METEERPTKRRKKYRADGSMRPAAARYKRKRERKLRSAWLAEFEPGVRAAFFQAVDLDHAIFAGPFARKHGLTKDGAEADLAEFAESKGWLSLVTRTGRTVGVGPPKVERPAAKDGPDHFPPEE